MEKELKMLLNNAYAPISNFKVAAIIETKDKKIYKGVNIEDASLRAGSCAERVALYSAITDGIKKNMIATIHIMTESEYISTPCFVCRQMLYEYCDKNTLIKCYNISGKTKEYTLAELCPYPFSEQDIKKATDV